MQVFQEQQLLCLNKRNYYVSKYVKDALNEDFVIFWSI